MYCCIESTGRYLLIAMLLSAVTMLSQTAFQLYGVIAEPSDNGTLAPCEIRHSVDFCKPILCRMYTVSQKNCANLSFALCLSNIN